MKYLFAILLTACAPTQSFNSTEAAQAQDCVIAHQCPVDTLKHYRDFIKAQRAIVTTNLVVRQDALLGDTIRARREATGLYQGLWWGEGESYHVYTAQAIVLPNLSLWTLLAAPDSTVPLPECRATDKIAPSHAAFYMDSSYMVWRTDSTYILIDIRTHWKNPLNLHVRPGGYAYWHNGWVVRPAAYTGYNASDELKDECHRGGTVPCGVFPPTWRISPPQVMVVRKDTDQVIIMYPETTRIFTIRNGLLTVEDR